MMLIYPAGFGGRIDIAGRLFIATYEAVGQNILVLFLKEMTVVYVVFVA